MKKSILSTHVLLFATFLIVTCQDQSVQFEQAPPQLSQTSNSVDKSWTERVQDGSFQLRVTVNDSFDTNEAFKMVDFVNDGGDCPPFEICID